MIAAPTSRERVRFGPFELDCRSGELRRDGHPVRLQPQPAKILTILVSRPAEVVSRQELSKQVWGSDTFVDFEQGLNFAIRQIRSVLEDEVEHPRYLETIPKRGYRFIAPVQNAAGPAAHSTAATGPPRNAKWYYGLAFASVVVAAIGIVLIFGAYQFGPHQTSHIQSIAVLPLRNLSTDPEYEYFSEGMTDELITHLAKINRLRVISHTSVNRYRDTKLPVREIAKELGVDAVIEGTVLRSGNRIRITAQLIDAMTDQHLWAESYERDVKDVLALQNEVSQQIASEVGMSLTASDQAHLAGTPTPDAVTHELYLKGSLYSSQVNCSGWTKGLAYFEQAIARDPNYALAHLGAGDAYFHLGDSACRPQAEAFAKSRASALKSLQLDSGLGKAHTLLGRLAFYHDWDWPRANEEYKKGIELGPNEADGHGAYAVFLVAMNRQDEGLAEIQKAHQLDPVSEHTNMLESYVLYLSRRYDQAIEQAKRTIELYPRSGAAYYWLGQAYERKGMNPEAANAYMASGSFGTDDKREWLESSRQAFQAGGIAGYWKRQSLEKQNQGPGGACWKSLLSAHMGDKTQTLEWLNYGFEHHCDGLQFLKAEPVYDSFRDDPKFKELVSQLHL